MPARRSKPSIASCRQATPQARMIVRARSTSPPSRCTWRVAASMRSIDAGDEDLGAEPPRLLQRAARQLVARHAGREAEVVLDPRGGAGLAARGLAARSRSCAAPPTPRRRPPRARRARRRRSPCRTPRAVGLGRQPQQLGHPPQLRADDRLAVDDPDGRAGPRPPAAARPSCSAASGASGAIHLNVIWLRSRKCRSSVQRRVPAMADDDRPRRGRLGREALEAARAAHPVRGQSPTSAPTSGATAAIAW